MDRMITKNHKKIWFKAFELIDLFPYSIALLTIAAEIYIINGFISITPMLHY